MQTLNLISYFIFLLAMGYYVITNLQWYSYKLERVLFHHTKGWWHFAYFLVPYGFYMLMNNATNYAFVVVFIYVGILYGWYRGLDKPLVWTERVKRFYVIMVFFGFFIAFAFGHFGVIIPIFLTYFITGFIEKILFNSFRKKAQIKLKSMENLIVVGITASYGKTSIKNFVAHLLSAKYNTYATPRSVNTLGGVIKDINDDLPPNTEIYVVEMGARGEGDIAEISTFVSPHYVIVGKIGPAHIEYFKSMENIRNTKMEIMQTKQLKEAYIHESAMVEPEHKHVHIYGTGEMIQENVSLSMPEFIISDVEATLEGTGFTLGDTCYTASILGAFNAMNLAAAVLLAKEMGLDNMTIQKQLSTLKAVNHRLQRIDAGGKVILDDSFNGNIDGMMAAFDLAASYKGRKIVITPGLIEADNTLNELVAKRVNEVFDMVVVTGDLNYTIFKQLVDPVKLVKLESKAKMEEMLVEQTRVGDLILFANDAPSFV
ncbi:MAG: UDP-N-acetylmuramoyl-tripeptide--D-alanyl-D-alanine ligase [Sulfurovum sp.]|nr:UDP-N-acetylmuramoyl-tripeptide--D-alanyl-D-alanine ligase [Sulfurovum sp.]